jgi:hypothetical protein
VIWKRGVTREVVLIGRWALKFPSIRCWRLFLQGLLCNMHEQIWAIDSEWKTKTAPVVFGVPGGFSNVMKRCDPLSDLDFCHDQ